MSILYAYINLVPVTLMQSVIYAFAALGIMIPFRLLSFPDLTVEGSFPLGGCVAAALIAARVDPWLATLAALFAGAAAGLATASLHLWLRLNTLLCGILVLTMLFSINIRVMGKPNIAQLGRHGPQGLHRKQAAPGRKRRPVPRRRRRRSGPRGHRRRAPERAGTRGGRRGRAVRGQADAEADPAGFARGAGCPGRAEGQPGRRDGLRQREHRGGLLRSSAAPGHLARTGAGLSRHGGCAGPARGGRICGWLRRRLRAGRPGQRGFAQPAHGRRDRR